MNYKEILEQISSKLSLPIEVIKEAYESYWEYIRNTISELPLKEDLTEEEFNKLRTNFNIPSIGKLSCTYSRYRYMKDRYKYVKKLKDGNYNKESETTV